MAHVWTGRLTVVARDRSGMRWQSVQTDGPHEERERSDGFATVRVRERPDGGFLVRLDVLEQAPAGPTYRRETREDRGAAEALAREWMTAFDPDAPDRANDG